MAVTTRRALSVVAALWISAAVIFIGFEAIAAAAIPSYSYTAKYISVLGVPEWSPRAMLMNWGFYLQGALFLAGAVVAVRAVHTRRSGVAFLLLTATNAVGNFLVGFVHGFSPLWNDGYEWLHGFGAFLAIGGGNAAIVVGSVVVGRAVSAHWYQPIGVMMGVAGLVFAAMLHTYARWAVDFSHIGLVERACVYTIIGWQVFTGIVLLARPRKNVAAPRVEEEGVG
ncbi:hypothetical protein MGAD_01640 [Mycolicibacterium gadium]|jgi:hypothetical membrane protein|uniref:DUF998 domain-containing protein n=1 Tax=Mycolicibacterium gadium TaxID=1794 RepID=A0A7I7WE66_MYCGU|nr:hypothetical protein MGAD_01640 [Mycolicibacterium gadium]